MKTKLLVFRSLFYLVISLCSTLVFGQKYVPFPKENAEWHVILSRSYDYSLSGPYVFSVTNYMINGDSVINNKTYHKLFYSSDLSTYQLKGFLREENKRIYYLGSGGYSLQIKSLSNEIKNCMKSQLTYSENELILYDFNKNKVGDTISISTGTISAVDSILIQNTYRKIYSIPGDYIIEGIGSINQGLLGYITSRPICSYFDWEFLCFSQNAECVYKNPKYANCNSTDSWYARNYLKTGTQWYYGEKDYNYPLSFTDNYFSVKITGDTIVNGKNCKVMSHLRSKPTCFGYDSQVVLYQSNDTVYFYNTTSKKFSTLYVYGANKGDSWEVDYPTMKVMVKVDSIGSIFCLNNWNKVQYITYSMVDPNSGNMIFNCPSKIIEGIGDIAYFFKSNIKYLPICDELVDYTGLRCYVHPDYGTYHVPGTMDCSYVTDVKNATSKPVKVYINTNENLIIESESLSSPCTFELMDIRGSVILRTPVSSNQNSVNVGQFSKGLYLYRLINNGITLGTGKIVKQ